MSGPCEGRRFLGPIEAYRGFGPLAFIANILFLACLPVSVLLLMGGAWPLALFVFLIGIPFFWSIRNRAVAKGMMEAKFGPALSAPPRANVVVGEFFGGGRWEGVVEAGVDDLVIFGTHSWVEWNDPEQADKGHRCTRNRARIGFRGMRLCRRHFIQMVRSCWTRSRIRN